MDNQNLAYYILIRSGIKPQDTAPEACADFIVAMAERIKKERFEATQAEVNRQRQIEDVD